MFFSQFLKKRNSYQLKTKVIIILVLCLSSGFQNLMAEGSEEIDRTIQEGNLIEESGLSYLTRGFSFGYDLFEGHGSIMLLIDPDSGVIIDANDSAFKFYGYPVLIGMNISQINALSEEEVFAEMERARKFDLNFFHFRHLLASGTIKDVEVYSYPVEVGDQTVLFSIIHDISEKIESQQRSKLRTVMLIVVILIAAAAQLVFIIVLLKNKKRLSKAREDAEKANYAKSLFLSNMSHEIRTPLNAVIGFLDLLSYTELSERQREYLDIVTNSADSLLDIINDILDLSKIEAGKLELNITRISIHKLVGLCADIVRHQVMLKSLKFNVIIDKNVPNWIDADSARLKQILINLLSNAIKFTENGLIELVVSFNEIDNLKGSILFKVKDTGIGIKEEDKTKLFQVFWQIDNSNTREYGGTGLGLVISSLLARKMGSEIYFDTVYGKGSTFYFSIETSYGNPPLTDPNSTVKQEPSFFVTDKPYKVMIVEDNPVNRELSKAAVLKVLTNAEVKIAENGAQAVELYLKEIFDMILMDVQMPVMDGIEATRKIRDYEKRTGRYVKIIALTAGVLQSEIDDCYKAGVDLFVGKPLKISDLSIVIKKTLE